MGRPRRALCEHPSLIPLVKEGQHQLIVLWTLHHCVITHKDFWKLQQVWMFKFSTLWKLFTDRKLEIMIKQIPVLIASTLLGSCPVSSSVSSSTVHIYFPASTARSSERRITRLACSTSYSLCWDRCCHPPLPAWLRWGSSNDLGPGATKCPLRRPPCEPRPRLRSDPATALKTWIGDMLCRVNAHILAWWGRWRRR